MKNSIDDFRLFLESQNLRHNTLMAYCNDVNHMRVWLEKNGVLRWHDMTLHLLKTYVTQLKSHGRSHATVNRKVASINRFISFINHDLVSDQKPELTLPKEKSKPLFILTKEQVLQLMKQPDTESVWGLRDLIILKMLYETGIKVTELMLIDLSDVDLKHRRIHAITDYGQRIVYINKELVKLIKRYLVKRNLAEGTANIPLFVNCYDKRLSRQGLWKVIKTMSSKVGLPDAMTPHTLRHSFAVHLLEDGGTRKHLQAIMGLLDQSSTKIYENYLVNESQDSLFEQDIR